MRFVSSDQGKHFRTKLMQGLSQQKEFVHIVVYRHRPQSNGIADRLVLTLKQWLRTQSWQTCQQLQPLLRQFQVEYNDRPHQGLAISGLSPNEFAKRVCLM
jgi:hypothetical protein